MNRMEFMQILESKLSDMSDSERKEALQYYNDYFDDAGVENEQEVMEALGSPDQVARSIKADQNSRETGEFTERGYRTQGSEDNQPIGLRNQDNSRQHQESSPRDYGPKREESKENPILKIILIIVICIVLSPVVLPIGAAVLGIVLGILGILFGLFIAAAVSGAALLLAGFICFVVGIVKVFINPLAGAVILGTSFLLLGLGILLTILMVWLCAKLIPVIVRGMVNLIRRPFEKRGGNKA